MSNSNGHCDSKAPEQDTLKPLHRLVLMFDGTGNKRLNLSNVARMFEAIDDSNPKDYESLTSTKGSCEESVLESERQPVQLLKYIKGVGTDILGHFSGLGFGYGLSANVIEGYVWLSNNYCKGDEIFVFGFSRGAFSARSLVSLVHRCGGVLKNPSIHAKNTPELKENNSVVLKAYDMYQAYVQTGVQTTKSDGLDKKTALKDPALNKVFQDACKDFKDSADAANLRIEPVPVKMLGVWDTVGAVGLPSTRSRIIDNYVYPFSRYSGKQYQFHDQGLSCIVENAYHALAIDEHRQHFKPTLWDAATEGNKEVKQVWFVGSHCNVGGGADLENSKDPDDLWLYSYVWMQNHAIKNGLRFYWTYDSPTSRSMSSPGTPVHTRRVSLHPCEDSYDPFLGGSYKWVCRNRFYREAIETNGAKLHWSVVDRLKLADVLFARGLEQNYCWPPTLFGQYGRKVTMVGLDKVEIDKLDSKTDLVKKTLWEIETDDIAETDGTVKRTQELKPVNPCGCDEKVGVPETQTGLWSWLGL